jgi:hypothetical protein
MLRMTYRTCACIPCDGCSLQWRPSFYIDCSCYMVTRLSLKK